MDDAFAPGHARARPHHVPRLRAHADGGDRRADGARAPAVVPLAPVRGRGGPGLLRRAERRWWCSSCRGRARRARALTVVESGFDRIPAGAPRRGVPHERRGLGRADGEHREACRRRRDARAAVVAAARPPRRSSPRSATRRACAWSRAWARAAPLSIARLTEGADVTRQAVTKHLRVLAERRPRARHASGPRAACGSSTRHRSTTRAARWSSSRSAGTSGSRG